MFFERSAPVSARLVCAALGFLMLAPLSVAPLSVAPLSVAPLLAAPRVAKSQPAAAPSTLTFRMTARIGSSRAFAGAQQVVQARVSLRGQSARIETDAGGTSAVVLFLPPYVYRLLPDVKAGVRWKVDPRQKSSSADFDPQVLLRNPALLKGALVRGGAKKTGVGVLDKMPVDIYEAQNFGRPGQAMKLWLRRTDSLPVRLEARGTDLQISASWRDYLRSKTLPASLFAPPKDFRVREVAGPPPFSML